MNTRLLIRMTTPVVATSLLLLAVGVGAAWYVHRLQRSVSDELRANVSSMRAAEELEILVREIRTQLDHFLMTKDRKYLETVPAFRQETERWLAEAEYWGVETREQELTARARAGHQRFFAEMDQLLSQPTTGLLPEKIRGLIDDVLNREILQPTHEYLDFNEVEVEQSIDQNQVFASRLVYGLLLLGTCGSAAGVVAGVGFARGFSRSLVQLSVPIRDAAGRLDEVVGPITFSATGDLKELESVLHLIAQRIGAVIERLRQSEREVLRAEQLAAVGQMAAGMAHELRNPLTSMKILVQAAQSGDGADIGNPDGRCGLGGRDLAVLEEEITRLERLTQSFLQFARPPQVEKKTLDVRPLVEQTIGMVASRAATTGTSIAYAPPAEPVTAAVDPGQFRQVLLNLLLNALDAVASGGAIRVGLENGADGWLTLCVADTGHGVPDSLGARIFTPFVTTKETGLGLGLSICKRIAEAHGGEITAANRPEGGAVFTLRLPASSQRTEDRGQRTEDRRQRTEERDKG
jgi:signal transduction histidine kinase